MDNYIEINKRLWNERTTHHVVSDFYDVNGFMAGGTSLNDIELELLGDINGKDVLHLQCHFGQDTISLGRMGAKATGVDFSDAAIAEAKKLSEKTGVKADFICCDIYSLPEYCEQQFDIIYTSYGVLGWLPDMGKWADIVSHFLKPGGQLILVEFHPVMWMFDNDFTKVQYSYFNRETIEENESGTYANKNAPLQLNSISWNHDLSEVLQPLLSAGLQLSRFNEFDYSPYNCFKNMIEISPGRYCIQGMEGKLPVVYALKASK